MKVILHGFAWLLFSLRVELHRLTQCQEHSCPLPSPTPLSGKAAWKSQNPQEEIDFACLHCPSSWASKHQPPWGVQELEKPRQNTDVVGIFSGRHLSSNRQGRAPLSPRTWFSTCGAWPLWGHISYVSHYLYYSYIVIQNSIKIIVTKQQRN